MSTIKIVRRYPGDETKYGKPSLVKTSLLSNQFLGLIPFIFPFQPY